MSEEDAKERERGREREGALQCLPQVCDTRLEKNTSLRKTAATGQDIFATRSTFSIFVVAGNHGTQRDCAIMRK